MSTELSSPLLDIVKRAMKAPAQGRAAQVKRRFEDCTSLVVVLVDDSGSMGDTIGVSGRAKREHANIALQDILKYHPGVWVWAFSTTPQRLLDGKMPGLGGATNFLPALKAVAALKPRKTIIISDGQPTDPQGLDRIVEFAQNMTGAIDTIYCGPDGSPDLDFLRRLSRECAGVSMNWDGYQHELSPMIRGLLPAPVTP
jgi:Mg-chelatase subunit ChlD